MRTTGGGRGETNPAQTTRISQVELHSLRLDHDAVNARGDLPFDVVASHVGEVKLSVPWSSLGRTPVRLHACIHPRKKLTTPIKRRDTELKPFQYLPGNQPPTPLPSSAHTRIPDKSTKSYDVTPN